MDSVLNKKIKNLANEEYKLDEKGPFEAFEIGAKRALDAVNAYLCVAAQLGKSVKIDDIRQFIDTIREK